PASASSCTSRPRRWRTRSASGVPRCSPRPWPVRRRFPRWRRPGPKIRRPAPTNRGTAMKANTIIGIVVAFVGLAVAATMEGSQIPAFINVPALLLIVAGTFGATFAGTTMAHFKKVGGLYKKAFGGEEYDRNAVVQQMVGFAERARREGLLAL